MAQFRLPDGNYPRVNVTKDSRTVIVQATDARSFIGPGHGFLVRGTYVTYTVAGEPAYDGVNTIVVLSAPYGGETAEGVIGVFFSSFTELGFPYPEQNDIETHVILGQALQAIDSYLRSQPVVSTGDTPPETPKVGDIWLDTN